MLRLIRILICFCTAGVLAVGCGGKGAVSEPDYSGLTAENHPRVIYTDADFADIVEQVSTGVNPQLAKIHETIISNATEYLEAPDLVRKMVGKRLPVCSAAVGRLTYCAYAYKTTGDERFLAQVERDMRTVCGFEDWNGPRHFLGAAELAGGLALAYDWLFDDLSEELKATVRQALYDFAVHPALYEKLDNDFYSMLNNWNSVCNGGLVCVALATYEDNPEIAQTIIDKALETNVKPMEVGYSPDGNYAEGYGYWNYGTVYETLLLTAMETTTGSDNGISDVEGFSKTGKYIMFMEGPSGYCFNYSDGGGKVSFCPALWYFAWKFGDCSVLYSEKDKIPSAHRLLPLVAWWASKINVNDISAPKENIFHGEGLTPVVLVHDTWTMDENDKFLGVKAGSAKANHAHMDVGSFVYDAEGVRWASDLGSDNYTQLESHLPQIFKMTDDSKRWTIFRDNNYNHNTLTINDRLHKVAGVSKFLEVIDSDGRRGAVVDLTEALVEEVSSAVRTIYISGDDLVVEDRITALEDKPANVRWTMVTPAVPTVGSHEVTLVQGDKIRCLTCSSSTGHEVEWTTWTTKSLNPWDSSNEGFYECGYTTTVNPGDTAVIEVRLTPKLE